jgi:hypothetical protein
MTIHVFDQPIPVVTPLGDALAIYIKSSGIFEDDEWCCCLKEDGQVRHFISAQIKIYHNETYGIKKNEKRRTSKKD